MGKSFEFSSAFFFSACALSACATSPAPQPVEPSTVASEPPAPIFVLADINGISATALDQKLGEADLIRREGNGEFRRYSFADCSLIVVLYRDGVGEAVVSRVEASAKQSGQPKPDLDACLARGPGSLADGSAADRLGA